MTKKIPLRDILIGQGHFETEDDALRAALAGEILVDEERAYSIHQKVAPDSIVRIKEGKRYVSRGGLKLEGAIKAFDVDVRGDHCLDIGASTGGFTDCLLKHGAAHVTCLDVNYGQLSWEIRSDDRTTVFERTNIRNAKPEEIGAPFDAIAIDVSFIGLAGLAPVISRLSKQGTKLLALVKPQFEAKRAEAEGGVIHDGEVRMRTVSEVSEALQENGFKTLGVEESPIKGPKGNIEYIVYAKYLQG